MENIQLRFYIFDLPIEKVGTFAYSDEEAISNIEKNYRIGFSNSQQFMRVLSKEQTEKHIYKLLKSSILSNSEGFKTGKEIDDKYILDLQEVWDSIS